MELRIDRLPHRILHLLDDIVQFHSRRPLGQGCPGTSTATAAETLRKFSTWGKREHRAGEHRRDAPPLRRRHKHAITNQASAGDNSSQAQTRIEQALLACPITYVTPLYVKGRAGEPVASMRSVGLDKGKITGRSVWAAISFTMASVNAPVAVDVPINMVG